MFYLLQIKLKRDATPCITLTLTRTLGTFDAPFVTRKPPKSCYVLPCNKQDKGVNFSRFFSASGAYSRLIVWFQFERSIGFFLIQTYIPAYLIVMLSWIAFWISHNSTPGQSNFSDKIAHKRAWHSNDHFDSDSLLLFLTYSSAVGNPSVRCWLHRDDGTREGQKNHFFL